MTTYLLNCHGENSVEVTTAEAGRTIDCPCGKQVLVPTMREIRLLPRKKEPKVEAAPTWSTQKGVLFSIGLVLLAGGLIYGGFLIYQRMQLDTEEIVIRDDQWDALDTGVQSLSPERTLEVWQQFNMPLPEERRPPRFEIHREAARAVYIKLAISGTVALLGLALMGAGLAIKPPAPVRRRRPRASVQ